MKKRRTWSMTQVSAPRPATALNESLPMFTLPLPSRRLLPLPPLPRLTHWLPRLGRNRPQRPIQDSAQAALEACASEGAEVDLRAVELDGQPYGALYRNGELVCLLPPSSPQNTDR